MVALGGPSAIFGSRAARSRGDRNPVAGPSSDNNGRHRWAAARNVAPHRLWAAPERSCQTQTPRRRPRTRRCVDDVGTPGRLGTTISKPRRPKAVAGSPIRKACKRQRRHGRISGCPETTYPIAAGQRVRPPLQMLVSLIARVDGSSNAAKRAIEALTARNRSRRSHPFSFDAGKQPVSPERLPFSTFSPNAIRSEHNDDEDETSRRHRGSWQP